MPVKVTIIDNSGMYKGSIVSGGYKGSIDLLARNVVAGFDAWSSVLAPSSGVIDILLELVADGGAVATADGASLQSVYMGKPGTLDLYSFGAGREVVTGNDENGTEPDIKIRISIGFLESGWVNPLDGSLCPANKYNIVETFAHEIGHGLGFSGWRDWTTAELPGNYASIFDSLVKMVGEQPYFIGAKAVAVYGGPVPLMRGNLMHVGNATGAGADIKSDVMGARSATRVGDVLTYLGRNVTALDGAILSDLGLPTIFNDNLLGTDLDDRINGGDGDDVIGGKLGNDAIQGGAGADTVAGGGGDDTITDVSGTNYLRGEDGNDSISGGTGFDDINGNKGNDTITGGPGGDWLVGGQDNDLITSTGGNDILYGNLGNDTLNGGSGNEVIRGGQGDDVLTGGVGNDYVSGDKGSDTMTGGMGADIFHSFGDAGIDRVTDFNLSQGDRVQLDPGTVFTLSQVGADTIVNMTGGGQMTLVGIQLSSLTGNWIFGA